MNSALARHFLSLGFGGFQWISRRPDVARSAIAAAGNADVVLSPHKPQ